jgi:integrase/recombinase XerC
MVESFLQYLKFERRYSPNTLAAYTNDLHQFTHYLEEIYGLKDPAKAEFPFIRSWIVQLVEQQTESSSINRKIATLRTFYKFLLKREVIEHNPMLKIKTLKVARRLPQFVEEHKLSQLLDTFEFPEGFGGVRDRFVIEVSYGTGMRLSELLELREEDINLAEGVLKVTGKRNKERLVPLTQGLQRKLTAYHDLKKALFAEPSPFLIVTDRGMKPSRMFVYRLVKRYLTLAGITGKKSPHVLRHTFATHLLDKGADLNAIKDLLGHSSLAATQVYTHNSLEKLRKIFELAHPKA